jgi:hypothetical protein
MVARLPSGEPRMDVARRAIKGVVASIPGKARLSLRLYGAQSPAREKNCTDTNIAVPFAAAESNGGAVASTVETTKPQGYTPLSLSLQQGSNDFPAGAQERVIVLISDGKENCPGDPAVAAKALAAKGITVHTVGFLVDSAARGQLQAIARITGGSYFDSSVGPELPEVLKQAVSACRRQPEALPSNPGPGKLRTTSATYSHAVFNSETGQQVGKLDRLTREIELPAGIYEVQFGKARWKGIEVRPGETAAISPGELRLESRFGHTVRIFDSETGEAFGQIDAANAAATLMPGLYDLRFGQAEWRFVKVDGGATLTLKPAVVKLDRELKWQRARVTRRDGTEVFRFDAASRQVSLPPGEYVVEVDARKISFLASQGEVLDVKPE